MRDVVKGIESEFLRYKQLAERAINQLSDADLAKTSSEYDNSIATIVWHISGNLKSRFTDFLTSDGEKPWRHREEEFVRRALTKPELLARWNEGWSVLSDSLAHLSDADLTRTVTIRGHQLSVFDALLRSVTHFSHHVGQIVYIAKSLRGSAWDFLTIPPGQSEAYNRNPTHERPQRQA
jgi:hypothetical protein